MSPQICLMEISVESRARHLRPPPGPSFAGNTLRNTLPNNPFARLNLDRSFTLDCLPCDKIIINHRICPDCAPQPPRPGRRLAFDSKSLPRPAFSWSFALAARITRNRLFVDTLDFLSDPSRSAATTTTVMIILLANLILIWPPSSFNNVLNCCCPVAAASLLLRPPSLSADQRGPALSWGRFIVPRTIIYPI